MYTVTATKMDEVFLKIDCEPAIHQELKDFFKFRPKGFQFNPSFKHRIWDGFIYLYKPREKMLPIGLINHLKIFCEQRECDLKTNFELDILPPSDLNSFIDGLNLPYPLRDYQEKAVYHALSTQKSLLISPTASGKSLILYIITRFLNNKTLIIVPTLSLIHQMQGDFAEYSENNGWNVQKNTHLIYSKQEKDTDKQIIISTYQSLSNLPKPWFNVFDTVIVDEAHKAKAKSFKKILSSCINAKWRFGTTGTLDDCEVNKLDAQGFLGPKFTATKTEKLMKDGHVSELNIKCLYLQYSDEERKLVKKLAYAEEISYIIEHEKRNMTIASLVATLNKNVLITFRYNRHGKTLFELIKKLCHDRSVYFVAGETKVEEREKIRKNVNEDKNAIVIASEGVFSTGVNIKNLDVLILAAPGKAKINLLQSIGRILRLGEHSSKAVVYDIIDDFVWKSHKNYAFLHCLERIRIYESEKFPYKVYKIPL